jgi:hypothetical protein
MTVFEPPVGVTTATGAQTTLGRGLTGLVALGILGEAKGKSYTTTSACQ